MTEKQSTIDRRLQDAMAGIRRYSASDRSDPFTTARCITHTRLGIASYTRPASAKDADYTFAAGTLCPYDATMYREKRSFTRSSGEIVTYDVPAYKNMVRP